MTSRTPCSTRHGSCSARIKGSCCQCGHSRHSSARRKSLSSLAYADLLLIGFEDHVSRPNHASSQGYFSARDDPLTIFHKSSPASTESFQRSEKVASDCLRYLTEWSRLQTPDQSTYRRVPPDEILQEIRQGTWIIHYRFAEGHSDILPGLLDEYLQMWVLEGYRSDVSSQAGDYQSFKFVRSLLHFCAAFGCERLAKVYLQMGYNPNLIAHPGGQSPLHLAAAAGHLGMVKLLLRRGANNETRTVATGRTPLLLAAFRGRGEAITQLLEAGAAVDVQDDHGLTASALASASGYNQTATFVLGLNLGRMSLTVSSPMPPSETSAHGSHPSMKIPTSLQTADSKLQTRAEERSYRRLDSCSVSCSSCFSPSSIQHQDGPESTTSNPSLCLNCGHKQGENWDQENTDDWVEVDSDSCDESF